MDPGDLSWLAVECDRLLSFGLTASPGAWLDDEGHDTGRQRETWLVARALHVRSLGMLLGHAESRPIATEALAALTDELFDPVNGGWSTGEKACYEHAFVMLAASSAVTAGVPGAHALLEAAQSVFKQRFWDERSGMCIDGYNADWSVPSTYRGLNGTMHALEAMLAVGGVWTDRAGRICHRVVEIAAAHDWRLPEHYDEQWRPLLDLNRDRPADPFKPFGATVGHAFEWARLLLHLDAEAGTDHLDAAVALYERAAADGWAADGAEGFVYTTDWYGAPVVHDRMHWVLAEAVAAAAVLERRTGDPRYAEDARTWWAYAERHLIDRERGSWHHQLDRSNQPIDTVWPGKPDLYHAVQATLIPQLPIRGSIATAVARRST